MKIKVRTILPAILVLLIGIQFIPVHFNNPPVDKMINAPDSVMTILRSSCFDCHSNETRYPWYSKVAPASWLLASDINEGRAHLNLTEWTYSPERELKKLKHMKHMAVEEGDMPLWYYVMMHPGAKMSDKDKQILGNWLDSQIQMKKNGAGDKTMPDEDN